MKKKEPFNQRAFFYAVARVETAHGRPLDEPERDMLFVGVARHVATGKGCSVTVGAETSALASLIRSHSIEYGSAPTSGEITAYSLMADTIAAQSGERYR